MSDTSNEKGIFTPSSRVGLPLGLDMLVIGLSALVLVGQVGLLACRTMVIGVIILLLVLATVVVTMLLLVLGAMTVAAAGIVVLVA